MDSDFPDLRGDAGRPDVVISAALYLLSAYGRSGGCPRLAHVILRHLGVLADRADVAPVIRATCAQLAEQWERTLASILPPATAAPPAATLLPWRRRIVH